MRWENFRLHFAPASLQQNFLHLDLLMDVLGLELMFLEPGFPLVC